MTDDLRFERVARDWLELGPVEAPDDIVQAALFEIATTRQERGLRVPRRFPTMNTPLRLVLIGAALVAALAAGAVLIGGAPNRGVVVAPTATPTATPTPTPTPAPTPTQMPTPTPVVLGSTFTSSRYGYTIGIGDTWTATNATKAWVGHDNSPPAVDEIAVTGTDTTITVASQALSQGQTYSQFLAAQHAATVSDVPSGCDGGDPSTWPTVTIGGTQGGWDQLCNAAEALVLANQRVYVFGLSNATFNTSQHLSDADFKRVLASVTFTSP